MKRSRRMLLLCPDDCEVSTQKAGEDKREEKLIRKVFRHQHAVSPSIYTSPTSGQSLQILQNVTPISEISPLPSSNCIKILEDKILTPSDSATFSTPKRTKRLVTTNTPSNNSNKDTLSVSMSRCGSLSDISISNMVSLNSSFDEEQIFDLLATPSSKCADKTKENTPSSVIKYTSSSGQLSTARIDTAQLEQPSTSTHRFFNYSSSDDELTTPNTDVSQLRQPTTSSNASDINRSVRQEKTRLYTISSSDDEDSKESSSDSSIASDHISDDENIIGDIEPTATEPVVNDDDEWQDITSNGPNFEQYMGNSETFIPANVKDPDEFYRLFLTDEIIDKIVLETNKYAMKNMNADNLKEKSRSKLWKPTNREEMLKFFGIILAMGLVKVPTIKDYWSKKKVYRNEYISSLMSRDRFLLLLKSWHFSDDTTSDANDKLCKIRVVYDMLLQQFTKLLKSGTVLVIDETMIPWRGRLRFRQYIKNKSHKYGVKLYKLCTPEGYTYNIIIYTGKEDSGQDIAHGTKVVLQLIKNLENEGRIIVVDNFYTSVGLAEALISKKTFILGTLRANRRGLPKKVVSTKLKKGQIDGKMNKKGVRIIKWVDKRPVLMMSTCKNHDATVKDTGRTRRGTNESVKKPECVLSYNNYKKGIDYSDQMSSYYSTLKKGLK